MSATKQLLSDVFEEQHNEFLTDDSYEDYLRMEKDHQQSLALEELEMQHAGSVMSRSSNWKNHENDFFAKQNNSTNDLPF